MLNPAQKIHWNPHPNNSRSGVLQGKSGGGREGESVKGAGDLSYKYI